MKNGIFYTNSNGVMLKVGSEDCSEGFSEEDRKNFTHVEFWIQGRLMLNAEVNVYSHQYLLKWTKDNIK